MLAVRVVDSDTQQLKDCSRFQSFGYQKGLFMITYPLAGKSDVKIKTSRIATHELLIEAHSTPTLKIPQDSLTKESTSGEPLLQMMVFQHPPHYWKEEQTLQTPGFSETASRPALGSSKHSSGCAFEGGGGVG